MVDNEGIQVNEAHNCLLCSGEGLPLYSDLRDRLFGASGNWSLMQCPKCQIVWLNPRPIPEDIGKLYSKYFTHQAIDTPTGVLTGLNKSLKASILQSSFGYEIEESNKIIGSVLSKIRPLKDIAGGNVRYLNGCEKGRLLDVGCGNGIFLDQMKQLGWEVMGVEPDGGAASVAVKKFGLEVFQGSLKEAKFPNGHFHAITLNHVLEHVLDPIELLKECRRVLRPGGKLVVATPNIRSLGAHVFGEYWRGFEVPRHLFLFSTRALRACAKAAELDIQELRTTANLGRYIWAASSLIRRGDMHQSCSPEAPGLKLRLEGLAFQASEHGLCGIWGAGEELVMVATK